MILKDLGVTVHNVLELDYIESVKRAVLIVAGFSIVPQASICQEISKQTLASVQLDDGDFFRPLAAIYKKNKVLSPAIRQFVSLLKENDGK
jgi:DNA-binding transcriptional LysR family regulator